MRVSFVATMSKRIDMSMSRDGNMRGCAIRGERDYRPKISGNIVYATLRCQ